MSAFSGKGKGALFKKSRGTDHLSGVGEDWVMGPDTVDRARQFLLRMYGSDRTSLHEARLVSENESSIKHCTGMH